MDEAANDFLARAAFALNKQRNLSRRQALKFSAKLGHCRTRAKNHLIGWKIAQR